MELAEIKNSKCFTRIIIIKKNKIIQSLFTLIIIKDVKQITQCRIIYGDWKIADHLHPKRKRLNDSFPLLYITLYS